MPASLSLSPHSEMYNVYGNTWLRCWNVDLVFLKASLRPLLCVSMCQAELIFQYAAHGTRGLHVSFQAMCAQVGIIDALHTSDKLCTGT